MLTDKEQAGIRERYFAGGHRCPHCGHEDDSRLWGDGPEYQDRDVRIGEFSCEECGATWVEWYDFAGIALCKPGDDHDALEWEYVPMSTEAVTS